MITAAIRPNDSNDPIASAFGNEIKGGHHGYATITERDSIIVERREWAEFCGMLVTPLGIIKDPIKTWAALKLAEKRGDMKDMRDSYERDVCLAYQHKDALHSIFC